jgi:Druantia protein DruA/Transposase Tn5 dimerisation domain/Transposase DNA-binding
VRASGREFSDADITAIEQAIGGKPGISRRALSREICDRLGWYSIDGKPKQMSCRVALLKLERGGHIRLPAPRVFTARRQAQAMEAAAQTVLIQCRLEKLQPIELVPIRSGNRAHSKIWNGLMEQYHPLGPGPLCGAQLRYLIRGVNGEWLGGLAFSAAAWRLQARDEWIGWNAEARKQNLHRVAANSRFLILPHVRVTHLASHVLGLAVGRLQEDWKQRYGDELLLLETFVDTEHYRGTCYRASNWIEVGKTQGRGRQDGKHNRPSSVKRIFMYALDAQAKQQLCRAEIQPPIQPRPRPPASDWAEEEFGNARLGHERLRRRLLTIARDFYARPQAQIPQACQSRARTKAAYRFFQHPETTMDALLEPHIEATQQRLRKEKIVLAVQDTTSLNYSTHPATHDLGPIGSSPDGIIGLIVHDTMAFSVEGTPLGLLDVQCWARNGEEFGKKHQRKQLPIEQKESSKWLQSFRHVDQVQQQCPETTLVSVGDREADIYELFHLALEKSSGPKLLVRAEQDRLLADGQGHLWTIVQQQPRVGLQQLHVPRRHQRASRQAQLEIRFAEVTLKPPYGKARYGSLTLWAILAQEVNAPVGIEPLAWMLLTTCRVETFNDAIEKLNWYTKRWCIEIYHRTLKSGCKIEERQLGAAIRIEACLAIDMVVAWRVYHLTKLGREVPDVPCTVFFEHAEWIALTAFITQNPVPPAQPPSLHQAIRMVASLGGFLGRKGDGEPGTKSLWLGLQRLDDITATAKIYNPKLRPPPVSSASSYG